MSEFISSNTLTTLTIVNEDRQKEINELQEKVRKLEAAVKEIDRAFHVVFGMEGFNDGSFDDLPFGPAPWKKGRQNND